jgi:hypothetical protein
MSIDLQSATDRPETGTGIDDHGAGYIGGWAISGLMTLATILVLWHFHI